MPSDLLTLRVTTERTDVYEWQAIYTDGTALDEYGLDGTQHGWKDINQDRLVCLILIPKRDHLRTHALQVTANARPIFFRRRKREVSLETGEQVSDTETITVLGMQWTVKGVNVASFSYFFSDGSVTVSDRSDL